MVATWRPESKKPNRMDWAKYLILLAPRPGLEPGTCGLTEIQAAQNFNIFNGLYKKNHFV
jgi:hypothetical protein